MLRNLEARRRWTTCVVSWSVVIACAVLGFADSPPDYEVIEIPGFYGEPVWYPTDLNNLGVVVGAAWVDLGGSACTQPFVWSKETGTTGLGGELDPVLGSELLVKAGAALEMLQEAG